MKSALRSIEKTFRLKIRSSEISRAGTCQLFEDFFPFPVIIGLKEIS